MTSVLIIEDTPETVFILSYHLEEMGCKVSVCHRGEDGIEAIRYGHFNLVLMDMRLPDIDGIEATRRIRAFSPVPVVGWSADISGRQREDGFAAGMSDVREKTLLRDDVRLVVQGFAK